MERTYDNVLFVNRTKETYIVLVIIVLVAAGVVFTANEDNSQQTNTPAGEQSKITADHFTNHTDLLADTSTDYYPHKRKREGTTGYLSVLESASTDTPTPRAQ